jgi:hypothetical protein
MNRFQSLQSLLDYIPNCVICGKHMHLRFEGRLDNPRSYSTSERIRFKIEKKGSTLHSKSKEHKIAVNPVDNSILDGLPIIQRMGTAANVYKSCETCDFKIHCRIDKPQAANLPIFPELLLSQEVMNYTLKGGRTIYIQKFYTNDIPLHDAYVILNKKALATRVPWDFDKFRDLEHMNKRIDTIIMFH